ncbi:hypothetical protein NicSoilB4_16280 [Arthrobacter sp. NicSoilB4]|uniref:hypothetical protein n=1 Tax=Arthrobacter sp. NicSoilB4 TaxID=2830997 RepID=UPI001CC4AC2C|nr:hypothetical protein [Arthrobacter sp. NicSoilB4]BCW66865.1 hypothetical protein NicSoilB4_16280 [Arthrobacter sp. NicSoilB4]
MSHRRTTVLIVGADGVIARDQIARVLLDSLHIDAANHKTLELIADYGPEQDELTTVFAALTPDSGKSLDAAEDLVDLPMESEPELSRDDLATITAGSLNAGD